MIKDYSGATMTRHGYERAKERMNCSGKSAARFISLAVERGKDYTEFNANERAFLKAKLRTPDTKILVYNGYCFLLNEDNYCITMYELPKWFGKKPTHYDGKIKVKNPKKYSHMVDSYDEYDCYDVA